MLLHGQATCCDQLHQNEQEKQVHLENINLLTMAENIFLALKGIKPVVFFFFFFFFHFRKIFYLGLRCCPSKCFAPLRIIFSFFSHLLDRYVQRFQATYQLFRKVKKKPALHLHSSQRSLAQLFACPPPTLT